MRLLWRGSWIEAPGYTVPDSAVLIDIRVAVPILRIQHASGRVLQRPLAKAATFLRTDGPRRTLRKVRAKREEPLYTDDFRTAAVLGHVVASSKPVAALACRVPPAAQQLPVHHRLVRDVSDECDLDDLLTIASTLLRKQGRLDTLTRQNFLYSGMEPPNELIELFDDAVRVSSPQSIKAMPTAMPSPIRISTRLGTPADTAIQLRSTQRSSDTPVALLGAGDYARTEIIPALRSKGMSLHAVVNREPQIAAMVGEKYGFTVATTDCYRAIAGMPRRGLVVVATAHDSHAQLASTAASAGHRVFLEKPPAVTSEDVTLLLESMTSWPGAIEIGFNRRYHRLIVKARRQLQREQGPISMTCIIKEVALEADHWYFWPNQGTRITGNLCHWIDLAVFFLDKGVQPVSVGLSPRVADRSTMVDEERVLTVSFDDGSLLTIVATGRGDDMRGVQEQIEIRRGRSTVMIDDLWRMRVRRDGFDRFTRTLFRDKAHRDMYRLALHRAAQGQPAVYAPRDMVVVSAIQIAASELAKSQELHCDLPPWLGPALESLA